MATVKILLKKNKSNRKGQSPLYLRITKNRKTQFISLGIYLSAIHWDEVRCRVKKSFPNSQRTNNFLAQKVAEGEGVALEMESNSKYVASQKIKETIMGKNSESFFKFAQRYIQETENNNKVASAKRAKSIIKKIKTYVTNQDLLFEEINVNWLRNYESYMRTKLGNATNTIHTNLKFIRKLIHDAIAEELLPIEKNPFARFKLKWDQTRKEYLTEEELHRLDTLPLVKNSAKDHHRNMYVFAAYTGGLRISDILMLKWKDFDGEKICMQTKKAATMVSIKLPSRSLEILKQYQKKESQKEDFIFPFLKNDVDYKDNWLLNRSVSSATAYTNNDLKDIAKAAAIEKHLHFHTSRHTWATRALQKGMRIEYVSKLMGHNSIRTTQIYAKIVNEDLDNAMEVFK